jgi:L-lactate dehydrogenase complex protein LldG
MMPGQTKEQFLSRIRNALRDRGEPVDLPADLEASRVIASDADLAATFAQRVEEAFMKPYRVANEDEMVDKVAEIVDSLGAKSAIVPDDELPGRIRIVERLKGKGLAISSPDDADASFEADVGITGVVGAIAESASMIVASGGARRRLASLAVPNHIAVVRAGQIVPDLIDWFAKNEASEAASEVLISAPSKTADIELSLVMGVHGPKEEHVVIIG